MMGAMCGASGCPCYSTCDLRGDAERCATWRANRKGRILTARNTAACAAKRARRFDDMSPLPEAEYMRRVEENAAGMPPFLRTAYVRSRVVSAWFWKKLRWA